jgi:hypothetical protein
MIFPCLHLADRFVGQSKGGLLKKVSCYEFLMYRNVRRVIHTKSARNQQKFDGFFLSLIKRPFFETVKSNESKFD